MDVRVGTVLAGRYEIRERVGQGGQAQVYRAWDREGACQFALKFLQTDPSRKAHDMERFRREAQVLGSLEHPHIVRVYRLVEDAQPALYQLLRRIAGKLGLRGILHKVHHTAIHPPFFVMHYVEGQTLRQRADARQRQPFPLDEAVKLVYPIGGALSVIHAHRVYHRDVKPSNIMIDAEDKPILTDFGTALSIDRTRLTGSKYVGTLRYMAPEQLDKDLEIDATTDIHALGEILYELLTGACPYDAVTETALIGQILRQSPRLPRELNPQIPEGVQRVILKALEKKQADRYSTMVQFINALRDAADLQDTFPAIIETKIASPRPWWPLWLTLVLAVIAIVLLIGVGLFVFAPNLRSGGTAAARETAMAPSAAVLVQPSATATATLAPTHTPTWTPTPTAAPTSTPTEAPSPTATLPAPSPTPWLAVSTQQLDVYTGPETSYGTLAQVGSGVRLPIRGRSADGRWWQVDYLGQPGWVRAQSVVAHADLESVPTVQAPPLGNRRPTIRRVWPLSTTVQAGSTMTLTCEATDDDQDALTYAWAAERGAFLGDGDTVSYRAPEEAGIQRIAVTVDDGRGGQAQGATEIEVTPLEPPEHRYRPAVSFVPIWEAHTEVRERLGWATQELDLVTRAAQQPFERGLAFWQRDQYMVHVLETGGLYEVHKSTWEERLGDYSCPEVAESRTPPTPRRRIGQVWCDELGGPSAAIGWATADEYEYDAHWQPFERGMMWLGSDGQIYAFYDDDSWQSFPVP